MADHHYNRTRVERYIKMFLNF